MIRVSVDSKRVEKLLIGLRDGLSPKELDPIVGKAALQHQAGLAAASPKHWFGQIASGWESNRIALGVWAVDIPPGKQTAQGKPISDIARFVNEGTAGDGAGLIFPTRAKRLFIPLVRSAAAGWRAGMVWGRDYILRPFVRGIKGRHFIEPERAKAAAGLRDAVAKYARDLVRGRR